MRLGLGVLAIAVAACGSRGDDRGAATQSRPSCTRDADCVVSCVTRDDCCRHPTCDRVVPVSEARTIEQHNRDHPHDCSADEVFACPPHDPGANVLEVIPHCRAGTCVVEKIDRGKPRHPEDAVIDLAPFRRPCTADADCTLVRDMPCNECKCVDGPISKSELARFEALSASLLDRCGVAFGSCGDCKDYVAACDRGTCVARQAR